jgi:hypothetical protein
MTDTQTDTPGIPALLRVWREDGSLFVLFPTVPSDIEGSFCSSYDPACGHSGADYGFCIQQSRPVEDKRAIADLLDKLKKVGYRVRVVKRATAAMHGDRRTEAQQMREIMIARTQLREKQP